MPTRLHAALNATRAHAHVDTPPVPITMPPAATAQATRTGTTYDIYTGRPLPRAASSTAITTTTYTGHPVPRAVSSYDSGAAPPSYEDLMGDSKGAAHRSSFV